MRIVKILLVAMLLLPLAAEAQTKNTPQAPPKAEASVDKYPNFDVKEAATLWKRWMRKEAFTQEDCCRVIELCTIAYDYLNVELTAIIDNNTSADKRRQLAQNLQDTDKSGDMTTFTRSFSIRMQELAYKKQLEPEVAKKSNEMTAKKKENRRLIDIIFH